MKKSFGIFMIMGLILICGISITAFTNHYFGTRLDQAEQQPVSQAQALTETEAVPESLIESILDDSLAGDSPRSFMAPAADVDSDTELTETEAALNDSVIIRIDEDESAVAIDDKEEYEEKLQELESSLLILWDDEEVSTTKEMQEVAAYELAAWDFELNNIYQLLREKLPPEEFDIIKLEEREWVKERDSIASAAAAEYEGGSIESITYTKTLTEETKKRTYALVDYYFENEE